MNAQKQLWLLSLLIITFFLWGCGTTEEVPAEPAGVESPEAADEPADVPDSGQEIMDEEQLMSLFSSGKELDEVYYVMTMSTTEMDPFISRIWTKDGRMRAETEMMGQEFTTIYDVNAVYTFEAEEQVAIRMAPGFGMDESMDAFTADDLTSTFDTDRLEYMGTEMYNGLLCHVVRSVDLETGQAVEIWLHPDYGFPMRVESLSEDPDEQYLMEVTEFQIGGIPDNMFTVPDGYEIIDMEDMFQNMPVIPGS
jgi:hypothetical protein